MVPTEFFFSTCRDLRAVQETYSSLSFVSVSRPLGFGKRPIPAPGFRLSYCSPRGTLALFSINVYLPEIFMQSLKRSRAVNMAN